jgi:uncharacterized membrane protein
MLVLVGVACYAIVFGSTFIAAFSASASGNAAPEPNLGVTLVTSVLFQIAISVLSCFFLSSIVQMGLKGIRSEPISISDAFSGFTKQPLQVLLASLITGIAVGIGTVLCYIPAFIVGGLLCITIPYIVDRNMSAIEALKASWSTMSPFWVMGAILYFLGSMVAGLGICACFVGVFVTAPMFYVMNAVVYEDLTADPYGQSSSAPAPL